MDIVALLHCLQPPLTATTLLTHPAVSTVRVQYARYSVAVAHTCARVWRPRLNPVRLHEISDQVALPYILFFMGKESENWDRNERRFLLIQ